MRLAPVLGERGRVGGRLWLRAALADACASVGKPAAAVDDGEVQRERRPCRSNERVIAPMRSLEAKSAQYGMG